VSLLLGAFSVADLFCVAGIVTSLKNVKKDVQEMRKGTECGIAFEKWEEFQEGDVIQTYEEKSEKRALNI